MRSFKLTISNANAKGERWGNSGVAAADEKEFKPNVCAQIVELRKKDAYVL